MAFKLDKIDDVTLVDHIQILTEPSLVGLCVRVLQGNDPSL
jgi:hypothetical protein